MDEKFGDINGLLEEKASGKDVEGLASKFVTFDEFDQFREEVRQEFSALRLSIQSLTNSVDKLVKAISDLRIEYTAISH